MYQKSIHWRGKCRGHIRGRTLKNGDGINEIKTFKKGVLNIIKYTN